MNQVYIIGENQDGSLPKDDVTSWLFILMFLPL